jgi:hypothetical protein
MIRRLIKGHIWCPPERKVEGKGACSLCGEEIDLNPRTGNYYDVWVGYVCPVCHFAYEDKIEELGDL